MRCKFQPKAKSDLRTIAQYIGRDNLARSVSYIKEIEQHCQKLADRPGVGRPRPRYANGLRSIPHGNYLIFYLVRDDDLIVVRVLHGSRDIDQIMLNQ